MGAPSPLNCLTCQKRRRKCDRGQPHCKRCARDGKTCEGYNKTRTFVNFDSNNIATHGKKVFSAAVCNRRLEDELIKLNGPKHMSRLAAITEFNSIAMDSSPYVWAISIPDMLETNFREHAYALHGQFMEQHAQTSGAWSIHLQKLLDQNRAFDLAVIALSCRRLYQSNNNHYLQTIYLSAYGRSMNIFKAQCKRIIERGESTVHPVMIITGLIYCLFEFMHYNPSTILQSGMIEGNPHLHGALALMQKNGPFAFSEGAQHLAFKKIREIAILSATARRVPNFLALDEWMTIPWSVNTKEYRDQIYDCAANSTDIHHMVYNCTCSLEDCRRKISSISKELSIHQAAWIDTLSGSHTALVDEYHAVKVLNLQQAADIDIFLLKLETEAMHFWLSLISAQSMLNAQDFSAEATKDFELLWSLIDRRQGELRRALASPIFELQPQRSGGIVEAHCRTLFANWALREYEHISCDRKNYLANISNSET